MKHVPRETRFTRSRNVYVARIAQGLKNNKQGFIIPVEFFPLKVTTRCLPTLATTACHASSLSKQVSNYGKDSEGAWDISEAHATYTHATTPLDCPPSQKTHCGT
jgi:hypothetical protein